jgi:hypothetical protein
VSESRPPLPPDPAFQQQFGRSRGLLLAPVVVVAAIALWVGAVQLGGRPPDPTPRPGGSAPVAVASASAGPGSPTGPPTLPPPMLQLFGPAPPGAVLIRDRELRQVDLATGARSEPIGESGYLDRMLSLPDGGYACVCVRQRTRGEERSHDVDVVRFDASGDRGGTVELGTWVGTDLPGLHQEPGPFSLDAAHSADGRFLAVTTSLRRPPEWVREVVVVDLEALTVTGRLELPATPSAVGAQAGTGASPEPAGPRWAWAPIPRFSPAGAHLLLSGAEVDERDGPVGYRTWVLRMEGGRLAGDVQLRPDQDPGDDPCRDAVPEWAADDLIVALCFGDRFGGPFLRRDRPDGTGMRRVSLRDALKDSAAPYLLGDGRGSVWLWDAWSTRAIKVDAEAGVVEATTTMPDRGTPERFLFPSAVLSPDGRRLIVAVVASARDPGSIHVLDAQTLDGVSDWATEPGLMTVGASADGKWLYLGHAPQWNQDGVAEAPARLGVIDLETGTLRARLGQVGDSAFSIISRGSPGD